MDQQPRLTLRKATQKANSHQSLLRGLHAWPSRWRLGRQRRIARRLAQAGLFAAVRGMASALATSLIIWWVAHR